MNTQKIYQKYKKNTKALSPVVASIILIAVTVAVSVVVAAWMSGSIFNLMGTTEQATITNLDLTDTGQVIATVQNAGNAPLTITAAYIDGQAATCATLPDEILAGASGSYTLTVEVGGVAVDPLFASGDQVTVKMTTSAGNNLILTQTVPSA